MSQQETISSTDHKDAMEILNMFPEHLHLLPQTPQLNFLFTVIRNVETQRTDFIFYSERIIRLILEAALCLIPVKPCDVITPVGAVYKGVRPDDRGIIGVSIMRAGESMERVLREMCPGVRIGKILVQRDETSADKSPDARFSYSKLPADIASRRVLLLDPMCATGGSAIKATEILIKEYGVLEENIIFLNLISAPEGIKRYLGRFPNIQIVTAAIDNDLDENSYIVPGLGDFGDRYFGTISE
ncbi:uracil phosphoribosyltransferase, putative [Leishmania tarentolae]|uniref:uracil phosphoribosyltransferase n=1 Tax=Leishmania tarentolae TaxID=5689 RepID=A0A640KXG1_LEITA|nr:uracil phosphoribosyltransferase, putative [Leishmania tarentolae]